MATLPFPVPYGQRASLEVYGDGATAEAAKAHIIQQLLAIDGAVKEDGSQVKMKKKTIIKCTHPV